MFYGPLKAVPTWDLETGVASAIALVGFAALLWRLRFSSRSSGAMRSAVQVAGAGLAMLVIGYALAFTHFPPNALVGRGTSVHLGATIGMSVLATGVAWLLIDWRSHVAVAAVSTYLALAVGYYVTIERDFIHSWQLQRAFWQEVVACCSDLQDGTVLLYTLSSAEEPTFIFTNSWADPLILGETLAFPRSWSQPPRLFSLTDWQSRVQSDDSGTLRWWVPAASWDEHWEALPQRNVVLLSRSADGSLTRVTGDVSVAGAELALKPAAAPQAWPAAQLYAPLLQP